VKADVFLKKADGSLFEGRVWPGPAVYPDWFHSNTQDYWDQEFASFFDPNSGIDIDALWIDMNEPSNFCEYPCTDPGAPATEDRLQVEGRDSTNEQSLSARKVRDGEANTRNAGQKRVKRADDPAKVVERGVAERQENGTKKGIPGRDLINPLYKIQNAMGSLSNKTADTDLIHQGGWAEYDTHNL
jgi:alpha-glucosidase